MRDGRYDEARSSFSAALEQYVQSADIANQANLLLSLGELSRLEENFDGAESALVRVTQLAQSLEDQQLEGRAYTALAALNLQMLSLDAAESHYAKALELAEACGDQKMSSYIQIGLGEVQSRMESDEALGSIVRGAQGFASLGHEHGMGAAMLRLAQHSIRIGRPVLALVAAESSRRFWRRSDPVRGVGQSLRIIVKALAALKRWESLLFVAKARVLIAGSLQHNSVDVLEFYVDKAPDEWLERMSAMSDKVLIDRAEQEIAGVISELLPDGEQGLNKLGTILGGMSTIESILMTKTDSMVESVESVQFVEQSKGEIV
jgi:hypothetical protein